METLNVCSHLWETETLYCADVVAYCACNLDQELFVCGTYQLEESEDNVKSSSTNKRLGSLHLYQLSRDVKEQCEHLQTLILPGVLDAKWIRTSEAPCISVALASGQIRLFKLHNEELVENLAADVACEEGLSLTLDCSSEDCRIVTSDSKGFVCLLEMSSFSDRPIQNQWKAHDLEVWAVALCNQDKTTIYSGADDCLFKVWDIRNHRQPQATIKKHTMGVTCITTSKTRQYQLLTGSYDEKIRLWDIRTLKNPVSECETGGGIWRLKWDPDEDLLLAACMHNGFHIYNETLKLKASYLKHKSLAYGADWVHSNFESKSKLAITCSFYDRSLQIWSVDMSDKNTT